MRIKRHGIPDPLYSDGKNAFVLTREPAEAEIPAGILKPKGHFGRACGGPGIGGTAANSPRAKGRTGAEGIISTECRLYF